MAIDLTKPLAWTSATHEEQQMLRDLQGNILKGHGRPETTNIFFRLDPTKAQASRRALREIANFHVTSAYEQLRATQRFHDSGASGDTFVAAMLSFSGYVAIERQPSAPAGEPQFVKGMRHATSLAAVKDDLALWEPHFAQQIDGMILIGDMVRNRVRLKRDAVADILAEAGATILHEQEGSAIKDKNDNGIEHFGYVDGRSQPLLLVEDITKEAKDAGIARWDPEFGLGAALVAEPPATPGAVNFGSYFIFRKLEQDVRGFKRREQELATELLLTGEEQREIAGAMVVGRFEDGTPVTMSDEARNANPPNDFNYAGDGGSRCPFQAHIRKVNPRDTGATGSAQRTHIMPRRGIPFVDVARQVHPSDLPGSESVADFDVNVAPKLPTGGVGLLFMAYNSSLTKQFVFTQKSWANDPAFPSANIGIDPIIGQGFISGTTPKPKWHEAWDEPTSTNHTFDFHGFVKMRGGEYFFAPSLGFLKGL